MKRSILLPLIFVLAGTLAAGQTTEGEKTFEKAEELRKRYHFVDALDIYRELLEKITDSLIISKINTSVALSENGLNMLQYAVRPTVTGKSTVSLRDFYKYLPPYLSGEWAELPAYLNSNLRQNSFPNPVMLRNGHTSIFFSAQDQDGRWDIYQIQQVDGDNWSAPEPLGPLINSEGDEIFPFVSPNGRQLYFASSGHFGVGGFDIYVSNWNDRTADWDLPQNLGFPYSSVDDDFMFIPRDNQESSYLVSNRNLTSADSVTIYRLDFESTPVRRAIGSIDEAIEIASLGLPITKQRDTVPEVREVMTTPQTEEYSKMIMEVRKIQGEIDNTTREISANRMLYTTLTNEDDRIFLERKIFEGELALLDMQSRLREANKVVQMREMEFLSKGAIIPRSEDFFKEEKDEQPPQFPPFDPQQIQPAAFPQLNILEPVRLFDYTFALADEAVMAEDSSIPDGLVYRVQLFVVSNKPDLRAFRGLRPIFENRTPTNRWLYAAGQFYRYDDAANALNVVKRAGFPTAIIVAYHNGKSITIRNARTLEERLSAMATFQLKIEGYPGGIPQPVLDIIRNNTDKDLARKVINGKEIYFIGPFPNRATAEQLLNLLSGLGAEGLSIEEIPVAD